MRHIGAAGIQRGFASDASNRRKTNDDPSASEVEDFLSTEYTPSIPADEALRKLQILIGINAKGEYQESWDQAWDYYQNLDEDFRTAEIRLGLMNILSSSPRSRDWHRLLSVFEQVDILERTSSMYLEAILFYLKVKIPDKAVASHSEALDALGTGPNIGSDLLIAHLISGGDWDLMLRAWTDRVDTYDNSERPGQLPPEALRSWQDSLQLTLGSMPGLNSKVLAFMNAIDAGTVLGAYSEEAFSLFVFLVNSVLNKGVSFGTTRNKDVLSFLHRHNSANASMYEILCMRTLDPTGPSPAIRMSHAHQIYHQYRRNCTPFCPSRRLLHTMIKAAVGVNDIEYALVLLADWRTYHQDPPSSLTGLMIKGLATSGDLDQAQKLLEQYISRQHGDIPSIKLFYPLLQFHAERGAPEVVMAELDKIRSQKMEPDTICWNILLNAHEKADDLEGVLSALSSMLEAGMQPDAYTVGTVMAASASRGDVDLCDQMLNMANDNHNGIPRTATMNDCMVLALLNDRQVGKAELFARQVTTNTATIASTRMWNQILSYHSLSSRTEAVRNTTRIAQEMQRLKVRFDGLTYSCLMRAYVVERKPAIARRILQKTMQTKVQATALHYAIVMDGYADMQMFEQGIRMHADMLARGITPDRNSHVALQRLQLSAARARLVQERGKLSEVRIDVLDELLEEIIPSTEIAKPVSGTPELYSSKFSGAEGAAAALFNLPISFYSDVRAYDVVKTLIDRYEELYPAQSQDAAPLRFIAHFMNLHYRTGDFASVSRFWELAKAKATRTSRLVSPSTSNYIAPTRRYILSPHIDIYLRALAGQPASTNRANAMYNTFQSLFALGFDLDNRNWNLYVQLLATHGAHSTAFALCEQHLMGTFPASWSPVEPRVRYFQASRTKAPGSEFLGPRGTFLRRGELRATYKTMVRFALVLRRLRREAPFRNDSRKELEEIKKAAPKTVRAVLAMPMVDHPVATHVLGGRARNGDRRTVD